MRGLGFAPVIIAATGGPTNPVGITVTLALGAAWVISKFLPIGAGHKEADYLTDHRTGAQTHAGEALSQVIDYHDAHPEIWSPEEIDGVISAIEKIRDDFTGYARQFQRAGPGAIQTIQEIVGRLIQDRLHEKESLHPLPPQEPFTEPVTGVQKPMDNNVRLYLISEEPYHRIDTALADGSGQIQFMDHPGTTAETYFYDYVRANHEKIYRVRDEAEAHAIMNGQKPVPEGTDPPGGFGSLGWLLAGAYAATRLFG